MGQDEIIETESMQFVHYVNQIDQACPEFNPFPQEKLFTPKK